MRVSPATRLLPGAVRMVCGVREWLTRGMRVGLATRLLPCAVQIVRY